ncbi:MAG: sulfate adenylyltransferase, partial [Actinomycetota bacterium]
RSANMDWYKGGTLLHHLENLYIASDRNMVDVRFPVQYVVRPQSTEHHDYRGYAGSVAGGVMKPGDEVAVLPSGFSSRIKAIVGPQGEVEEASAPDAVTILLEDELDISRGDMICRVNNQPAATQDLEAMVCWMSEASQLTPGAKLGIKHTTKWARAMVKDFRYRLDINTLNRDLDAQSLSLNEIGRVRLRITQPLFADTYRRNRSTGSFILVDETTNVTVGAGMIRETE